MSTLEETLGGGDGEGVERVIEVPAGLVRSLVIEHIGHSNQTVSFMPLNFETKDTGDDGKTSPEELNVNNMLTDQCESYSHNIIGENWLARIGWRE